MKRLLSLLFVVLFFCLTLGFDPAEAEAQRGRRGRDRDGDRGRSSFRDFDRFRGRSNFQDFGRFRSRSRLPLPFFGRFRDDDDINIIVAPDSFRSSFRSDFYDDDDTQTFIRLRNGQLIRVD